MENNEVFKRLSVINVNKYTEKKNGLTYLSWACAWDILRRCYPDASYDIWKDEQGRPYLYDENLGYMVFTSVTVCGNRIEMQMPVTDASNKAMKNTEYTYQTKYGEKTVEAATMFDINTAIMRCLVKNIAMHGLGLYIFEGHENPPAPPAPKPVNKPAEVDGKAG